MHPGAPFAGDFGPFDGRAWLNTAHQGPLPRVAVTAAREAIERKAQPHRLEDDDFFQVPAGLRAALGRVIGAAPDDIILGNSTTYGLDLLANGIQWRGGDEVLLVKGDFPADVFPWLTLRDRGVTVRFIESSSAALDPAQLAQEISPKTRVFCTTWVNSFTGYAIDMDSIGRVCRENHVIFVLNGAQGLGARTLDVARSPVDAVTCCGYKWLCGPYATGFCWLTPALRESLSIRHGYWLTMQIGKPLDQMRDYSLREDLGARAWDVFCPANFLNFVPWTAALEYLLDAGVARIEEWDQQLIERIVHGLDEDRFELISPRSGAQRTTLVVIRPRSDRNAREWHQQLSRAGLDVAVREGNLRISPHLHNSVEDVERLVEVLAG